MAHYAVPLVTGEVCWGALNLLWPGSRPEGLSAAGEARIGATADRMAEVLRDAAAHGRPVRPRDEPLVMIRPPDGGADPATTPVGRLPEGFAAFDLGGRLIFPTDRAVHLLGRDRAELLGT
ncbi:hypothetical protein [Streptomyces liangshanensis]|uniref:hypothetical protein n=1 Tax=Streptomyces liangshanensis TaxID=2717324 RepID=UPI0036DE2D36